MHFNSRAHARRDSGARSIYTLFMSFQLTRPRKARHPLYLEIDTSKSFQLTRPRKARRAWYMIFAPAREFQLTRQRKARLCVDKMRLIEQNFNSRAHARRDVGGREDARIYRKFQLTRPRKARLLWVVLWQDMTDFNSRAHARRDLPQFYNRFGRGYFNSRATQGATLFRETSEMFGIFQLTRPRKARPCKARKRSCGNSISTHAPTQGATAPFLSAPISL